MRWGARPVRDVPRYRDLVGNRALIGFIALIVLSVIVLGVGRFIVGPGRVVLLGVALGLGVAAELIAELGRRLAASLGERGGVLAQASEDGASTGLHTSAEALIVLAADQRQAAFHLRRCLPGGEHRQRPKQTAMVRQLIRTFASFRVRIRS
jgi:hypothetical protein